jgi:hypothetical protein
MKKYNIYLALIILATALIGCDENEIMPKYSKLGTATATVATVVPSKTTATFSETITLTMKFVNLSSDPVQQVTLRAKVGAGGTYTDVQTFDEQSAAKDAEITHVVNYVTPASAATVTFDMVITSQKEYPQVKRTSVTVK